MVGKKLIQLKGKRKLDFQAWLIHADELEEAGRDEQAATVRIRGRIMQTLVEAVIPAARKQGRQEVRGELPDGGAFRAVCTEKIVSLFARLDGHEHATWFQMRRVIIADPARADYLPRRILELFE